MGLVGQAVVFHCICEDLAPQAPPTQNPESQSLCSCVEQKVSLVPGSETEILRREAGGNLGLWTFPALPPSSIYRREGRCACWPMPQPSARWMGLVL